MGQLQLLRATSLGWLPDETVFSLASRFHRLSGYGSPARTCQLLFGHRQQGAAHDFPSRLVHLANASEGLLGTGETIARDHTILGFFLAFQSEEVQRLAIDALRGDGIGGIKFALGLPTSRFGAHHPLKACPRCMQLDLQRFQTTYWHRIHQVPGVWVCIEHEGILQECVVKSNYVCRFSFVLPDPALLRPVVGNLMEEALRAARSLATMSAGVLSLPPQFELKGQLLAQSLRDHIFARNTRMPPAQKKAVVARYNTHCAALRQIPELAGLPDSEAAAEANLASLVRSQRTGRHPIRWVAALACFFPDFRAFIDAYTRSSEPPEVPKSTRLPSPVAAQSSDPLRVAFLSALAQSSVRAASLQAGVDVATGMAWAAAAGVHVERRPKILKGVTRERMIKMLEAGLDKDVAAQRGDVSVSTVTRMLRTEVGLRHKWISARKSHARQEAREAWETAVLEAGARGIKFCRSLAPAAYAWLRRNDAEWLDASTRPIRLSRAGENNVHVAWEARDKQLAASIEGAAAILQARGETIRLWQLYQAVPELRPKQTKLSRLPLTAALLERLVGSKRAIGASVRLSM